MVKDIVKANETVKPNDREMAVLRAHFADCFQTDGAFDLARFQARLGDRLSISNEGYGLNFLGKNYARLLTAVDTTTVVVPDGEHNARPENAQSQNVYISGDNLDALKQLLKSYARQVKCIYIDPPYNTGSDGFVYNDRFNFTAEEIAARLNLSDEQAERILQFARRGSASHSAWLMFMYPRLQLARDLLSDDGVIFISIDDNEQANLKLLCDEVFSEQNYISTIACVNKPSGRSDDKYIATAHESILIYSRSENLALGGFDPEEQIIARYTKKDAEGRLYRDEDLRKRGSHDERSDRPNLFYPFFYNEATNDLKIGDNEDSTPEGYVRIMPMKDKETEGTWRWGKETALSDLSHLHAGHMDNKGQWTVYEIQYLDERGEVKPLSVWAQKDVNSERGTEAFESLGFDANVFQNPKPVGLLKRLLHIAKTRESLVVDFFSGSGTFAQAVMEENCEDGGKRKFILVQWKEACKAGSAADKAGYRTIDEIGRARIKRAAARIAAENPLLAKTMDLGFRHYTLKEPTGAQLETIEKFNPDEPILLASDDILKEFGLPTVLATWLVRDGYGLTAAPTKVELDGYVCWWMKDHLYFIEAGGQGLTEDGIVQLMEKYETDGSFNPSHVVIFGYGGLTWTMRENLERNLQKLRPDNNATGAKKLAITFDVRY